MQLADGTKMSVPRGDMPALHMDSQTPPAQSKPRVGVAGDLHDNPVLFSIGLPGKNNGIIKKFDIMGRKRKNVFSADHIKKGIKSLKPNEEILLRKIADVIVKSDSNGLIKEEFNQITAMIDGRVFTIKCFIKHGAVIMMNAFIGESDRLNRQLIKWIE